MRPMLCRTIDKNTLMKLVEDDRWATQQKVDGRRLSVNIDNGRTLAWGRDGQAVSPSVAISAALARTFPNGEFSLDGELIRVNSQFQRYIVFDLVRAGDLITAATPFAERYEALEHLTRIAGWENVEALSLLPMATDRIEKIRMVRRLVTANAEGVICRRLSAPYQPGRSHDIVKFKMTKTVDCVVKSLGFDGRKNMTLEVYGDDGQPIEIGRCSAAVGDGPGVRVGSVVTVTYLRLSESGKLVQPTRPILRLDKKPEECDFQQLVSITDYELLRSGMLSSYDVVDV